MDLYVTSFDTNENGIVLSVYSTTGHADDNCLLFFDRKGDRTKRIGFEYARSVPPAAFRCRWMSDDRILLKYDTGKRHTIQYVDASSAATINPARCEKVMPIAIFDLSVSEDKKDLAVCGHDYSTEHADKAVLVYHLPHFDQVFEPFLWKAQFGGSGRTLLISAGEQHLIRFEQHEHPNRPAGMSSLDIHQEYPYNDKGNMPARATRYGTGGRSSKPKPHTRITGRSVAPATRRGA